MPAELMQMSEGELSSRSMVSRQFADMNQFAVSLVMDWSALGLVNSPKHAV